MDPLVTALFLSVALGASAAIVAWRQRPAPGATPLVALLVGQTWWSACILFGEQATGVAGTIIWTNVSVVGVVLIPVAWLLFALAYTGRDWYLQPGYVALLTIVPAITIILVLAPGFESLYHVEVVSQTADGGLQLEQRGPLVWVLAGYTYLLGTLGAIPLVGLLASGAVTFRRQSIALLVGILSPWVTNILYLAGAFPTANIDPTPIAFSVSGVAYLSALTRHRLFGTNPAPTRRARQHLFDQMQMGAIVVDHNDHIVDSNDTFHTILDQPPQAILGAPASEWLPDYDAYPANGSLEDPITLGPDADAYDVTATTITDIHDRPLGRVITFHDISDLLRQQQRLEVLNRLLRHNIRTETSVIAGYATELEGDAADIIQERAHRITDFGEKGRTAIDLFDAAHGTTTPRPLRDLLDYAITTATDTTTTVTHSLPASEVYVADALRPVFVNLIENAVEHTDGPATIDITARHDGETATITISDDGPGIEQSELAVLDAGTETALEHGSGLGLWIIHWGIDIADGTIDYTTTDGTTATITIPTTQPPETPDRDRDYNRNPGYDRDHDHDHKDNPDREQSR